MRAGKVGRGSESGESEMRRGSGESGTGDGGNSGTGE